MHANRKGATAEIAGEVERKIQEGSDLFIVEERLHRNEHAVEVNVPMIQLAFGGAAVLPIEVPVNEKAGEMGRETRRPGDKGTRRRGDEGTW